jgi:hypothetical protein
MVCGITGLLSQIGGTWWKGARRFIIPLLMGATAWMFMGWSWWILAMVLTQWGAYSMPVTAFGDSIPGDWRNWFWLPCWGLLLCASPIWLGKEVILHATALGLLIGLFVALSNIKATAKIFQWKMVELFEGIFPAMVLCYLITK